jgi:hypothetical protein
MKRVLYAEEIEEAIMQYLVKQHGYLYNDLCNKQFKLFNQAYDVDSKELILTVSDLKCARVEIE